MYQEAVEIAYKKSWKNLLLTYALLLLFIAGILAIFALFILPKAPWGFYVMLGVMVAFFLYVSYFLGLSLTNLTKSHAALKKKDYRAYHHLEEVLIKLSFGSPRELFRGALVEADIFLDDLPQARKDFAALQNPAYIAAFAYLDAFLAFGEKDWAKAKEKTLAYKALAEKSPLLAAHLTSDALEAVLAHFEGKKVLPSDEALAREIGFPLVERLFSEEAWPASAIPPTPEARPAISGESAAKTPRLLSFFRTLSWATSLSVFLAVIWLTINRLSDDFFFGTFDCFGYLFIPIGLSLLSLFLGIFALKKKWGGCPKKNIVLGLILALVLTPFACLSFDTSFHDPSPVNALSLKADLALPSSPSAFVKKSNPDGKSDPALFALRNAEYRARYAEDETTLSFEKSLGSGAWLSAFPTALEDVFYPINELTFNGVEEIAAGYCLYNANTFEKNTLPSTSGEYHFYAFSYYSKNHILLVEDYVKWAPAKS